MNQPAKSVSFKGKVSSRSEASALIPNPGDYVIIFRGHARWLILRCPSGCGDLVPINLDRGAGPAWRFYKQKRGVSLYPSVVRETGCHSHFFIWNDRIIWCGSNDTYAPYLDGEDGLSDDLRKSILEIVQRKGRIHYTDIADRLNEVPWQVLRACRILRREGVLSEGSGRETGTFAMKARLGP